MNQEDYYMHIKNIINNYEGLNLHYKKGGHFQFPFYLTESAEKAGIENLELGVRSYNCLKRAGYNTIGQLAIGIHEALSPERRERYIDDVAKMNMEREISA